jgi:hypothetical protein
LGVALVAALPSGVWLALLGTALGSLTLGKSGVIYGMICVLVAFLRVVISGVEKGDGPSRRLFSEGVLLRCAAALLGGFVVGVYEILISGFSLSSLAFSLSMIIIPTALVPVLSVCFGSGVGLREFIIGSRSFFVRSAGNKKERVRMIAFKISLAVFLFLISFSMSEYKLFGVDVGLIFCAFATLFAAKRFGSIYGLCAGFIASFSISGLYSVSFALSGAAAGALFAFGLPYAVLGGGVALSLWGLYAGGGVGLLSVLPEYAVAAALALPLLRYLESERRQDGEVSVTRSATDMVGTMALAHGNKERSVVVGLEEAISGAARALERLSDGGETAQFLAAYSEISAIINEVALRAQDEKRMDEELTGKLEDVFADCGFPDGVIRAFGDRRKHIICAGEDKDGLLITSPRLHEEVERVCGMKVSTGEYFRRDNMVLMECEAVPMVHLEGAYAQAAGDGDEVSGDTVRTFETADMYSFAIIADGMGRGDLAKETSEFVTSFVESFMGSGAAVGTVLSAANAVMKGRREECSVGFDMFMIDKLKAQASFVKSGAAPSYIKRQESLFKISSRTVPMGLLASVDAEMISADVRAGDYVIMVSDGVISESESEGWLIEYLNRPAKKSPSEYAEGIIRAAMSRGGRRDDMSVAVLKIVGLRPFGVNE